MIQLITSFVASSLNKLREERGDAGVGFILTIATSLVIAAFVFIPGVRSFGGLIISGINDWWTNSIAPVIFPAA